VETTDLPCIIDPEKDIVFPSSDCELETTSTGSIGIPLDLEEHQQKMAAMRLEEELK
jgi:hypothetical protein